jgi:uridylate kinase
MSKPKYKRIILKLSGEAMLPEDSNYGVGLHTAGDIAGEISAAVKKGVQVGVVIGGGNIFRGAAAAAKGMERTSADAIGMLATVINSLALQEVLERNGTVSRVMTSIPMQGVAETFVRQDAVGHLESGNVVIFAGGTGHPYFSTDTAAALRAMQIHADAIFKATKVDGVYNADPVKNPSATRFDSLTYIDVLKQQLKVMDATAISMCMDNKLPIIVFNMFEKGNLTKAVMGENIGTVVYG